jgi:hypothetical protein
MSASDHLSSKQWEQLPMFMTAGDIKSKITYSDDGDVGGKLWSRKLSESKRGGLYRSIKAKGVKKPVELQRNLNRSTFTPVGYQLNDGHHRVAAAADIDPNMLVPVTHKTTNYR